MVQINEKNGEYQLQEDYKRSIIGIGLKEAQSSAGQADANE